ncbi:D-alanyl-D-alanine carboxypeptidase family protein [Gordonia neofelifaecis]|nr:D-alanyl-D-alanine carboxypeptidase family protein [Gordonia neofelifaecis]
MSMSVFKRTAAVFAALGVIVALSAAPASADPAVAVTPPVAPLTTPNTDACPHRTGTPPAVDESEAVAPGATAPAPLPVPDRPVGGDRLGGCGVVADPGAGPLPERLNSAGWLIADLDSGRVIAAKDPHGRYRPASTIKVLLALVALDELPLDKQVEATPEDWSMEGDSCGMGPGGHYTVRDLLSGLVVVSGNDCANALAGQLGGHDAALAKMNAKAAELGARDTRATSPSGLDAPGMSTSPYDLALLFREAMGNATFRQLISMKNYTFPGYPKRPDVPDDVDHPAWTMGTSNPLLRDDWPGMLGGKTGYTDDALKTFVGAAERNGRRIVITQMYGLNEADNMYAQQAERMFDYGFAAPESVDAGTLAVSAHEEHDSDVEAVLEHDDASPLSVWAIGLIAFAAVCLTSAAVLWRRRSPR